MHTGGLQGLVGTAIGLHQGVVHVFVGDGQAGHGGQGIHLGQLQRLQGCVQRSHAAAGAVGHRQRGAVPAPPQQLDLAAAHAQFHAQLIPEPQ